MPSISKVGKRPLGAIRLQAAPVMPSDGGAGGQGFVRGEQLKAELNAVKDQALGGAAVRLAHFAGDAIGGFLAQGLEDLPIVALDADGEVRLRVPYREHLLDGRLGAQNGHMKQRHWMGQPVRQRLRPGAFGEQKILPMGDAVNPAGEAMAH